MLRPTRRILQRAVRPYSSEAAVLLSSNNAGPSSPQWNQSPPPPQNNNNTQEYISDREWEIRTGRAMDILQQTLPKFFSTGLVATNYHLPLHMDTILGPGSDTLANSRGNSSNHPLKEINSENEGIYSRSVRLEYTPPVALPAPFPRALHIEGLPLYVASSVFVRTTLNALYTDLAVNMLKVQVKDGAKARSKDRDAGERRERDLAITIRLLVSGIGRLTLSSERAEWDVTSTYTFCPRTGFIILHTVNAIQPAPSETVYAAFQSTLSALSGGLGRGPAGGKGVLSTVKVKEPHSNNKV